MLRPDDAAQAAEIISACAAEDQPLEIISGGSKRGYGRTNRPARKLDISHLAGIIDYAPAELTLTAKAATPMAEIQQALAASGQMLAFEPPGWHAVFGTNAQPTLGGVIACNMSGPRRVRAGAARDHFLGFSAINGRGEVWKAGGKVVKNVTGYDMCKLNCGAFGTLSLLTEITVKVMPRPETEASLVLNGLTEEAAIKALSQALNTPYEVSAAAHLPAAAQTILRLEGPAPSVAFRAGAVAALFPGAELLDAAASAGIWTRIANVQPLLDPGLPVLWRICPTPASAPALVAAIRRALPSATAFYDWGGGLVWLSLDAAAPDAGAATIRAELAKIGGHATLITAPPDVTAEVFEPEPGPLAALSRRIKHNFDPLGILNPGRMRGGAD
jgi:glycolate oxidase FAD binding subunit